MFIHTAIYLVNVFCGHVDYTVVWTTTNIDGFEALLGNVITQSVNGFFTFFLFKRINIFLLHDFRNQIKHGIVKAGNERGRVVGRLVK